MREKLEDAWSFEPAPGLRNGHRMTLAGALWPRRFPRLPPAEPRLLEVAPDARLRLDCHWQPDRTRRPTFILVHGLEGSSRSRYMRGTAEKAWRAGANVVRMNLRNCGGTEALSVSLYHSGLSADVAAVARHLLDAEGLPEVHLVGFSLGGNQVVKLAGEWGGEAPAGVRSAAAVCPSLDLARCADALERPANRLYQAFFLRSLKARLRRKARLFPQVYQTDGIGLARTLRQFDDRFTAPLCGFGTAENYYRLASAAPLLGRIRLPTLLLAAADDPFVPIESFRAPAARENSAITLVTPEHGGHVGFRAARSPRRTVGGASRPDEDRWWAENRVVSFCLSHSALPAPLSE